MALFADTIKRFADNMVGLYNMFQTPDTESIRLFKKMTYIAMEGLDNHEEKYLQVMEAFKDYMRAGVFNCEYKGFEDKIIGILNN